MYNSTRIGVLVVAQWLLLPARTLFVAIAQNLSEEVARRKCVWNSYILMLGGTQETFVSMMW